MLVRIFLVLLSVVLCFPLSVSEAEQSCNPIYGCFEFTVAPSEVKVVNEIVRMSDTKEFSVSWGKGVYNVIFMNRDHVFTPKPNQLSTKLSAGEWIMKGFSLYGAYDDPYKPPENQSLIVKGSRSTKVFKPWYGLMETDTFHTFNISTTEWTPLGAILGFTSFIRVMWDIDVEVKVMQKTAIQPKSNGNGWGIWTYASLNSIRYLVAKGKGEVSLYNQDGIDEYHPFSVDENALQVTDESLQEYHTSHFYFDHYRNMIPFPVEISKKPGYKVVIIEAFNAVNVDLLQIKFSKEGKVFMRYTNNDIVVYQNGYKILPDEEFQGWKVFYGSPTRPLRFNGNGAGVVIVATQDETKFEILTKLLPSLLYRTDDLPRFVPWW